MALGVGTAAGQHRWADSSHAMAARVATAPNGTHTGQGPKRSGKGKRKGKERGGGKRRGAPSTGGEDDPVAAGQREAAASPASPKSETAEPAPPPSPGQVAIMAALGSGAREGLRMTPVSYVFTNRTTHSDVMSVATTTLIAAPDGAPPPPGPAGLGLTLSSTGGAAGGLGSAPLRPMGGARAGELRRIQLPTKLNPVPLPAPTKANRKRAAQMVKERDEFMKRLNEEREQRAMQENLAACRIQAVFRGHKARPVPTPVRPPRRKAWETEDTDWNAQLRNLTASTDRHIAGLKGLDEPSGEQDESEWRKKIRKRAASKSKKRYKKEARHYAALAVQTVARGAAARRAYKLMRWNAQQIREVKAVIRIQSSYRGHQLRANMAKAVADAQFRAAMLLQAHVRGVLARAFVRRIRDYITAMLEKEVSAARIQSMYKQRKGREIVHEVRMDGAAVDIQRAVRGRAARIHVQTRQRHKRELNERQTLGAIKMQASGRGFLVRQQTRPKLEMARTRRQRNQAATKIQSRHRANAARRKVDEKRAEKQEHAAVAIQSGFRGSKARQEVRAKREKVLKQRAEEKQERAAVDIQRVARGASSRKLVSDKRKKLEAEQQQKAAVRIQSSARGKRDRERVAKKRATVKAEKESKAATGLQRVARGRKARSEAADLRAQRRAEQLEQADAAPKRRKRGKRGSLQSRRSSGGAGAGGSAVSASAVGSADGKSVGGSMAAGDSEAPPASVGGSMADESPAAASKAGGGDRDGGGSTPSVGGSM